MVTRQATVMNEFGIHCRPSGVIAQAMAGTPGDLRVISPSGDVADPRQVISLMALGITCGTTVTIRVEGENEQAICDQLVELLQTNFDFKR